MAYGYNSFFKLRFNIIGIFQRFVHDTKRKNETFFLHFAELLEYSNDLVTFHRMSIKYSFINCWNIPTICL